MALADDLTAKLEAGRVATAKGLRALADQIERLPLDDVREALTWLEPYVERLRREAETIFGGRGPSK